MTPIGSPAWQPWPPDPTAGPGRPDRPATVTLAVILMLSAAVLVLFPIVSLVYELTHFDDVLRRAAQRTAAAAQEVDQQRVANRVVTGVGIVVAALTSAALAVPALWLRRGSAVARVLSCISAGAAAVCCCSGIGLGIAGQGSTGGSELQSEVSRLSAQETPVWVGLTALPAALVPLLAIAALVLLVVPPSNRFFRPPAAFPPGARPYAGYYAYPAQLWGGQPPSPPAGRPGTPPGGSSPGSPPDTPPDN
jgi:hypothetical protein